MARTRLIAALILTYVAFAMLLNSVGTVILQSISSFDVTKPQASTLEGFKDITIAIKVGKEYPMYEPAVRLHVEVACAD